MFLKVMPVVSVFCRIPLADGKRPTNQKGLRELEELEFGEYIFGRLAMSRFVALSGRIDLREVCRILKL